jgi:hypothetical protein
MAVLDEQPIAPDERAFRSDIEAQPFLVGVATGRWRLDAVVWPNAVISVSAAPRPTGMSELTLRFELTGYPIQGPTATPWDLSTNQQLDSSKLPVGRRASHVFRRDGWMNGQALYAPFDRIAIAGHDEWPVTFPYQCWKSDLDITFYLEHVYDLLHDDDYVGI